MPTRLVPAILVVLLCLAPVAGLPVAASGHTNADTGANGAPNAASSDTATTGNHTQRLPGTGGIVDVAPAPDGGTYLLGVTTPRTPNTTVTRLAPNGSVLWQRTYGGPNESRAGRAIVAGETGLYVLASVGEPRTGPRETAPSARLFHLETDGELAWNRPLGDTTLGVRSVDAVAAPDGGVVLARALPSREPATVLTQVSSDGTLAWNRTYEGGRPRTLARANDGGYLVGGVQEYRQAWVLRTTPDGRVDLNVTLTERPENRVVGVAPTADGGVFIVGDASARGFGGADPWAARLDADGAVRWSRTYPGENRVRARSVVATDDGLLAVYSETGRFGAERTRLVHVTPTGAVGTTITEGERLGTVPQVRDGTVRLYGTEYNRTGSTPETFELTVRGTLTETALPTAAPQSLVVHRKLTTNTTVYRGQNVEFTGVDEATYGLYRLPNEYTEFDEPQLVRRFSPTNGSVVFETATLGQGRYAVRSAPNFWLDFRDGDSAGYTTDASAAAFDLDERYLRFEFAPGERPRGLTDGPGFDDPVVETFEGEGVVEATLGAGRDDDGFTARIGLTRLNGSNPDADTLRAALAADPQYENGTVTEHGQTYGTLPMPADGDRNLTLDAAELPAGLYRVSVTDVETADASEAAETRLIVVQEERDVRVVPEDESLTLSRNETARTNLTLAGPTAGLSALRVEANRTGGPSVSLRLDLTEAIDYRSASGGGGLSPRRASAHAESTEIVSAPNESFVVTTLEVEVDRLGRDRDGVENGTNTITVRPAYVVDADGVPYSLGAPVTIEYEVVGGSDTEPDDASEDSTDEAGAGSGRSSGGSSGSGSATGSASSGA